MKNFKDDRINNLVRCLSYIIGYEDLTFSKDVAIEIKEVLEKEMNVKLCLVEQYKNLFSIEYLSGE